MIVPGGFLSRHAAADPDDTMITYDTKPAAGRAVQATPRQPREESPSGFAPTALALQQTVGNRVARRLLAAPAAVSTAIVQRAPLRYDSTAFTIAPPTPPLALKDAQDRVDRRKPADLTGGSVKGAAAGSDAEIFLWYILSILGTRDRWGTEIDTVTQIGWPAKPGDPAPLGKVTVTIDDKGNGVAELLSAGAVTAPAIYAARADAEKELQSAKYGIASVKDGDATWSIEDLNKVIGAFELLPEADRAALAEVDLERVHSLGAKVAGQFKSSATVPPEGTTATIGATLQLADLAFSGDPVSFVGGATAASPASPGSYQTIVHEVGHAIATKAYRDARAAHAKALAATNQKVADYNAALEVSNAAVDEYNTAATAYNDALKAKNKEAAAEAKPVAAEKKTAMDAAQGTTAVEKRTMEAGQADVTAKETARKSKLLPAAALAALKTDAETKQRTATAALTRATKTAASPASESYRQAVDAVSTAIGDLMTGAGTPGTEIDPLSDTAQQTVDERKQQREALETAAPGDPSPAAFTPVETAQNTALAAARLYAFATRRTARVHAFVTFVNKKKIAPFTTYAQENWPHKPEEFYAEAYSLWRTDRTFLSSNYPDLVTWFDAGKYK